MALITPDSGAGFSRLILFILRYKPWQASIVRPILQRKKLKLKITAKGHTVLKCCSQASNTLIPTLESVLPLPPSPHCPAPMNSYSYKNAPRAGNWPPI